MKIQSRPDPILAVVWDIARVEAMTNQLLNLDRTHAKTNILTMLWTLYSAEIIGDYRLEASEHKLVVVFCFPTGGIVNRFDVRL